MPPKSNTVNALSGTIETMNLNDAAPAAASAASASSSSASTLSAADRATVNECFQSLTELLDMLQAEASTPLATTTLIDAARLAQYGDMCAGAITKFVVFVSQGEVPILVEQQIELAKHLTGISNVLRSLLSPTSNAHSVQPGPTLRAQIVQVHTALVNGVRAILKQLQSHLLAKATTRLDVTLTGKAWSVIEQQLKATPLTNATAIGRNINQQLSVLKDARAELDQVHLATADETAAKDEDADEDDDDFEDDFDDNENALSPEEFAIIPAVRQVTDTAAALVKNLYMYILKVKIDESIATNIEWLESALQRVQSISHEFDELVGSVYSPQTRANVVEAIRAMTRELRHTAFAIVQHNAQSNAEWPVKAPAVSADAAIPSSSAAAAASFAASPDYQKVLDDATALQQPVDAQHEQRLAWLSLVLKQIHDGQSQAETL